MAGPTLWRGLKFYKLNEVMRQANVQFSCLLTKIGNGDILNNAELDLLKRGFSPERRRPNNAPTVYDCFSEIMTLNSITTEYFKWSQIK